MCQTVDHTDSRSGPYMAVGPHISNATCQQEAVRVTSEKAKKKTNVDVAKKQKINIDVNKESFS